jgi:hypothetical protein
MRQQIKWQGSGVLEYYPPKGRPTSATVVGYSQGTAELWASEAVTLDTYTDTFTNAGKGDTLLTVTDTTNAVIGRRYWVKTSTGGVGHEVVCVDIPSGTSIRLAAPLREAIASGIIEGHRLARTVTETTGLWRNSRALWTLTYSTGAVDKTTWFDIVGLPLTLDDVAVTEGDLEEVESEFGEAVDTVGSWRGYVARAFKYLWRKIERSYVPDLLRSRDMFDDALVYGTLWLRFKNDPVKEASYKAKLDDALADMLSSKEAWYDSDDDLLRSLFGRTIVQIGSDFLTVPVGSELIDGRNDGNTEGLPAPNMCRVT